jgi:hypothetical protein
VNTAHVVRATLRVARDLGQQAIWLDLSEQYARLSADAVAQGVLL